jgi:RimJ/RimL family protein N-acetyltransferase
MKSDPAYFNGERFTFVRMVSANFELLHRWLNESHVAARWAGPISLSEVCFKYQEAIDSPWIDPMIVSVNNTPIGFIQSYRASRVGEGWWPDFDDSVVGIDQFIGEVRYLGKGFGSALIAQYLEKLFADSTIRRVIADPAPDNLRAIRAYEKAGFTQAGNVLTPDGTALLMQISRS